MNPNQVTFPGLGIDMEVNRTAFTIFGLDIQWYGLIIALAFLLAVLYASKSAKSFHINRDKMFDVVLVSVVAGIIGARLYYVLFFPGSRYLDNPLEILYIWEGGLAFYGAAIGGGLGMFFASRWRKINVLAMLDIGAICLLLAQGMGRWGNFFNKEAYGIATEVPWRMGIYTNTGFQTVHPCFLYESLWCLAGLAFLHFFSRKWRRYDGQVIILYALWNGFGRFFIEGLRTDSLMLFGENGLRVSQGLALLMVIGAVVLLALLRKRNKLEGVGYHRTLADVQTDVAAGILEDTDTDKKKEKVKEKAEADTAEASPESAEPEETAQPDTQGEPEKTVEAAPPEAPAVQEETESPEEEIQKTGE